MPLPVPACFTPRLSRDRRVEGKQEGNTQSNKWGLILKRRAFGNGVTHFLSLPDNKTPAVASGEHRGKKRDFEEMIPVWALQLILHVSFRYQNAVGWGGVGCLYGYGGRPCRISCKLGGRQFCSDLHWLCPWPPSLPMSFLPMSFLALFTLGSHTVWPRDPQPSYHTLRYARSRHSNAFVCLWCAHVWYGEVQQLCQPRLQTWVLLPLRPTWSTAKGRRLEITYVFFLYLAQPSHRCILPATVCSGQGLDVSSSLHSCRERPALRTFFLSPLDYCRQKWVSDGLWIKEPVCLPFPPSVAVALIPKPHTKHEIFVNAFRHARASQSDF